MRRWLGLVVVIAGLTGALAPAAYAGPPPVISSLGAVNIKTSTATFRATVTWNEGQSKFWFTYCRPSLCLDTPVQNRVPPNSGLTPEDIAQPVTGLKPSTNYTLTLTAFNDSSDHGDGCCPVTKTTTFRTADPVIGSTPVAPSAVAEGPTGVTPYTATLNGTVIPGTTGGGNVETSVVFEWGLGNAFDHSSAPETLPADEGKYTVSEPLDELRPGSEYRYRVVAVRNGQRFVSAVRSATTPAVPPCPSGDRYQTTQIGHVIAVGCMRGAGERWVASTGVRINGVLFEPVGDGRSNTYSFGCGGSSACRALEDHLNTGNRLYLDKDGHAFGTTGRWKMSAASLPGMHTGVFDERSVDWGGDGPLLSAGADRSVDLIGFPLAGQLTWTAKDDGSSRLGLLVGLPVALGGVTGESAVKVNPGGDLSFDRLRIEVGSVPVKGFELGNVKFLYDRTENVWEGGGEVVLPTPTKITVGADVRVVNGQFGNFSGFVDNLNQHIAYGIYLQKVGVRFGLSPINLGGDIGLSAGPKIEGIGIFGVDGFYNVVAESSQKCVTRSFQPTICVTLPPYFELGGSVSVVSIPVRSAQVRFYLVDQAWIEASGQVGVDIKAGDITAFKLGGDVTGSLHGSAFELGGTVELIVFDYRVASASAIIGTAGVAACGSVGPFAVGGYQRWGQSGHSVWFCNMDDLRTALAARVSRAGVATPITLHAGDKTALIRFEGVGGAPQVRLHGPGGRVIDTPAKGVGNTSSPNRFISFRDEANRSTYVNLAGTGDGHWTYELLPGSVPVKSIESSRPLPAVGVHASARRHGGKVALKWKARRIAGQRVKFIEESPGAPPRVLKTTTKARGHVTFRALRLPERRRQIVAMVEQDGLPRARRVVAHYRAPKLGRVTRVRKLRAVRRGKTVRVSWGGMTSASKFHLIVADRKGRRTLRTVKKPRIALHRAKSVRSVSVRAIGIDGRVGKPRTARVRRHRR
jgi:hypothetical protein